MSIDRRSFIARWSRLKHAAEREAARPAQEAVPEMQTPRDVDNQVAGGHASSSTPAPVHEPARATEMPLPPIESLDGLRSDYEAFFQQPVDEQLRHAALKKLFADPHFNQMDMLDVYVDDYTQFEPLPPELRLRLPSARGFLLDSERAALEAAETATSGCVKSSVPDPNARQDRLASSSAGNEVCAVGGAATESDSTCAPLRQDNPADASVANRPPGEASSPASGPGVDRSDSSSS